MFVMMRNVVYMLLLGLLVIATPVIAKEAAPMAADPEMEKIVNEIAAELRCLVCQNQTIADSHAALAVDLKNQVREMVKQGKSRDDVVDYMVERYGDFVRYRPPIKPTTYLLWVGPFLLLAGGFIILAVNLRKRKELVTEAPLSEEEHQKLDSILHSENKEGEGR
ncbi:cytochrome c-type biogenesis protein [Kaarinaea lacus]